MAAGSVAVREEDLLQYDGIMSAQNPINLDNGRGVSERSLTAPLIGSLDKAKPANNATESDD